MYPIAPNTRSFAKASESRAHHILIEKLRVLALRLRSLKFRLQSSREKLQNTSSPILPYIQGSRPQVGKAHAPEDPFAAPASSKQPRFQDDNACYSLELSSLAYELGSELGCRPILQTRSIQQKYANVWSLAPRSLRHHSNSTAPQFKQWHHMAISNYNL